MFLFVGDMTVRVEIPGNLKEKKLQKLIIAFSNIVGQSVNMQKLIVYKNQFYLYILGINNMNQEIWNYNDVLKHQIQI